MASKGTKAYRAESNAEKGALQAVELDKAIKAYEAYGKAKTFADKAKHKAEALRAIREAKLCASGVREIASRATSIRNELAR